MADLRYYSKTFTREFLLLYREHPCLWKVKSREYKDKVMKEQAYQILANKLNEAAPNSDRGAVIRRINSLRSCYRKERIKVKNAIRSGAVYKPNLWYYDMLTFLNKVATHKSQTVCDSDDEFDEMNDADLAEDDNDPLEVIIKKDESINSITDIQQLLSDRTISEHSQASSTADENSRKRNKDDTLDVIYPTEVKRLKSEEDEYDIVGKNVAMKLRNLKSEMKIIAEKLINDVLFEAQMGTLTRYTTVFIPQ